MSKSDCSKLVILVWAITIAGEVSGQGLHVHHFGLEQGLSNNSVMNMYQDRDGYMWFGTYDGLNRYDGYNFKIYSNGIGDTSSLPSNVINCIAGDDAGNIWVGGQNGLAIYRGISESFIMVKYRPSTGDTIKPLGVWCSIYAP